MKKKLAFIPTREYIDMQQEENISKNKEKDSSQADGMR